MKLIIQLDKLINYFRKLQQIYHSLFQNKKNIEDTVTLSIVKKWLADNLNFDKTKLIEIPSDLE